MSLLRMQTLFSMVGIAEEFFTPARARRRIFGLVLIHNSIVAALAINIFQDAIDKIDT